MIVIVLAGVFGALFGSFLNVCIIRLPRDQSIVKPGSHCPSCKTPILWYDNIPVVSWIVLGGKCRKCHVGISILYPGVEFATASIWAVAIWYYGLGLGGITAAVFGTLMLGIAVTDAREYIIPDEFSLGGLGLGLGLAAVEGVPGLTAAATGALSGFAILYAVAFLGEKVFKKEAMGGGDIKMMAMVGAFVGWSGVLLTIFGGSLIGTVIFGPVALRKKVLVPFGVFLAIAAVGTFVWGDAISAWYLDYVMGP